jgi:hypothetical protein
MTLRIHSIYGFIRFLLLFLIFPWGGLCGGREEVLANGWTLDLLIERFNQCQEKAIAYDLEHPPSKNWGGEHIYAGYSVWLKNWATGKPFRFWRRKAS